MLKLTDVSKSFGDKLVLHPTTIEFAHGQTSVLIGTSGCGKSTLLRLIVGLITPDQGTIEFAGTLLTNENIQKIRLRMGYMIQDGGLFPHLSVEDNVTLLSQHLGWKRPRIQSRLQELLSLVHLDQGLLKQFPTQISGGQRQRVALMRALFLDPDVLLLDEPLGALDPIIRSSLQEDLRDIFRELNKTVVMVTHDISEAAFLGDCINVLQAGCIVQAGTFAELVENPHGKFVADFINAQRNPLDEVNGEQS